MIKSKRFWINVAVGLGFFLMISLTIDFFAGNKDWSMIYFVRRILTAFLFAMAFGYILTRRRSA